MGKFTRSYIKNLLEVMAVLSLLGCGEDSPTVDTTCEEPQNMQEFALQFCDSHLGVKQWSGPINNQLDIECLDGTKAYFNNFRLP